MDQDLLHLDNIDEFVNDQNVIVTYKWLSRTLEVHVNTAKQMLYQYVQKQRNENDSQSINVTYFISGIQIIDTEKVQRFCVVPEKKLEDTKSSFENIFNLHVYSVQKCNLLDSSSLYAADYEKQKEDNMSSNCYSAIKYSEVKISPVRTHIAKGEKNKSVIETKQPKNDQSSSKNQTENKETKSISNNTNNSKVNEKKGKNNGIASMFNNQSKTSKLEQKPEGLPSKPVKKPSKGIASMFAAQPKITKKSEETIESQEKEEKPVLKDTSKMDEVPNSPDLFDSPEVFNPKTKSEKVIKKTNKQLKRSLKKKSSSNSDDESGKSQKKRKRIRAVSSSSSSSSSESEDEMDQENTEPVMLDYGNEPAKEDPKDEDRRGRVQVTQSTKNRRQKYVDKTFIDEDGYMVTKKVWESASESEPEEAMETAAGTKLTVAPPTLQTVKKDVKSVKTVQAKKGGANKPKQASMMNFFKKKDS